MSQSVATESAKSLETPTRIRLQSPTQKDHHFFDVRIHAELDDAEPRSRKMPCLPVDLAVLMPIEWDAVPAAQQPEPEEYLGVEALIESADAEERARLLADLLPMAEQDPAPGYDELSRPLRQSLPVVDLADLPELAVERTLPLSPLKLLLAARAFEQMALEDPELQDVFDLLLDKIALAALLPLILSQKIWPDNAELESLLVPGEPGQLARQVDQHLAEALRQHAPLQRPSASELRNSDFAIQLPAQFWNGLIAHTAGPDPASPQRVLLPLDDLDDLLAEHLQQLLVRLAGEDPAVTEGWELVRESVQDDPKSWVSSGPEESGASIARRTDHGFFYPVIDRFFAEQRQRDIALLKLPFRSAAPLLPLVEEVDLRGAVWAREAAAITTELRIAARRYQLGKKQLEELAGNAANGDFELAADEMRRASRLWFDARKRFDFLRQEAARKGYDLTLGELHGGGEDLSPDHFYRLTQQVIEERRTVVRRSRAFWDTVRLKVRRCRRRRILFWSRKRCWDEYRVRKVRRWRTWYDTIVTRHKVDRPVVVDQDPVSTYLRAAISTSAFRDLADARAFARSIGKDQDSVQQGVDDQNRPVYQGLVNGDKQVHLFGFDDGEYRDQNGVRLDTILDHADPMASHRLGTLAPRRKLLLLIPVLERRLGGGLETVAFRAVHNPTKGRGANTAPRVYVQETYRLSLGQDPGHWLGALAHSVSLFPGETRQFHLVTEQKLETEQSRESLTSQKTSTERRISVRDQVRSEMERENRKESSSHWNASGGGGISLGIFSAKASAGGGGRNSRSSRKLSKRLTDKVTEVMNGASSSNEVQFRTSERSSESRSSLAEQHIEFSNVNQGRSVNYKFFQVLHCYSAGVHLADLRVVVEYSDELIPGLDIVRTRTHRLDELDTLLPEVVEEERVKLRQRLQDFVLERHRPRTVTFEDGTQQEVTFVRQDEEGRPLGVDPDNILELRRWYINSGAFHVDTEVSLEMATEPYVEEARAAEIALQQGLARRADAESEALASGHLVIPGNAGQLTVHLQHNGRQPDDEAADA